MSFIIELSGPGYSRIETISAGTLPHVVGRDPSSSIHVPDADRSVSRKHLSLDYSEFGVRVVVLSSVNSISTPHGEIQCGKQVILRPGEAAQLGAFTLFVRSPRMSPGFQPSEQALHDADPFAAISSSNTPQASVFDNAFFKPLAPGSVHPLAEGDVLDAFSPAAGSRGFSAGPTVHLTDVAPVVSASHRNTSTSDPLAAFDIGSESHIAPPSRSIDDFLGGARVGHASRLGASSMLLMHDQQGTRKLAIDHVHDFDLPLSSIAFTVKPPPSLFEPPTTAPMHSGTVFEVPAAVQEPLAKSWTDFSSEWMTPKTVPASENTVDATDPFFGGINSSAPDPFSDSWAAMPDWQGSAVSAGKPALVTAPEAMVATSAVPLPESNSATPEVARTRDGTAIAAMCKGLGLDSPTALDVTQWEQTGRAIRMMVHGLTELLNTRAEIKKELRAADRTMLGSQNNNPLKCGMAQEEILQYILFNPTGIGGYMKVDEALDEAINDLRAHEFASIAAVRAAVEGTVRDFEPQKLHIALTKGKSKLPQFLNNARLWDLYSAHYENKAEHMADWLEQLFNRYFVPVYSRESERLRSKRKAAPPKIDRPE